MHRAPGIHRPHRVAVPNPRSARYLSTHRSRIAAAGFTLVEVVVTLAIATLVMAGLVGVLDTAFKAEAAARERNALARDARFAMRRMVRAVSRTQRLMLPLAENPGTAWLESIREPGVLAVALDPSLDRDGDGFADADNDKDGLIDEDVGFDIHNDFASGLSGIDDDNDGEVDESNVEDDDEDEDDGGAKDEEISNGVDDDGDGTVDEDLDADMNQDNQPGIAGVDDDNDTMTDEGNKEDDDEDGTKDEDWLDPVAYFLSGTQLIERLPDLNPVDGTDYTERVIADNVIQFRVERVSQGAGRAALVDLTLTLTASDDQRVSVRTRVRAGGGR